MRETRCVMRKEKKIVHGRPENLHSLQSSSSSRNENTENSSGRVDYTTVTSAQLLHTWAVASQSYRKPTTYLQQRIARHGTARLRGKPALSCSQHDSVLLQEERESEQADHGRSRR